MGFLMERRRDGSVLRPQSLLEGLLVLLWATAPSPSLASELPGGGGDGGGGGGGGEEVATGPPALESDAPGAGVKADRAPSVERPRWDERAPPAPPPQGYVDGPLPHISDAFFSLIILVYVSVIFIFMFFSFCWKDPRPPPPDPAHKNIPMITTMLDEMERQEEEAAAAAAVAAAAGAEGQVPADEDPVGQFCEEEAHELQEKPLLERGGIKKAKVRVLPPRVDRVAHHANMETGGRQEGDLEEDFATTEA